VIHLLKEEEYFDFVRRDTSTAKSLNSSADLTSQEVTWKKRYAEIADRVTAIGMEFGGLRTKNARTPAENERLVQLAEDIKVARQAFQQFLSGLAQASDYVTPGGTTLAQLQEAQALMGVLRTLGPDVVALYTLVGEEKYQVIVITANTRTAREYPITRQQLNRKVAQFRQALWARTNPLPLAQELYRILIGPIAQDLHGAKAETLMWSLDGALRYVPVAALHDGEKYLVERYRNTVFTPASQLHMKDLPTLDWQVLGLGMSKEYEGFQPLPAVPQELRGIIRDGGNGGDGVLPGRIMLDDAFNQENLLDALQRRYPVVHIASHFHLQPGNEEDSFLLLGNGKLSVAEMKRLHDNLFEDVDLLTLSACSTAVGGMGEGGKEIESFGVEAQRQGAKAVIATLWPVADDSTKMLMQTFYRLRATQQGLAKAEALRQAQISLLHGLKEATQARERLYAHPFFWAPFILIGNWR
jgi:CHAT domain-containing protein